MSIADSKNQNADSGLNLQIIPDKPLVVMQPTKNWVALNLRDLWHY